jgi:peptidoglycan/LPS O-acetylase OafA/YrhL
MPAQSRALQFRPEVDGLRAIAALVIFAFHLDLPGFGGGFVGVDIFFAISGYVIIRGILKELEDGTFSLADFYTRRLRRIMPALIVVLLATLAVGYVILSPREYKELSDSALATIVFGANFFFHDRERYFADAAITRPLLHMWSLGVEEQFYIFVPFVVSWLRRALGIHPLRTVLTIAILSFVYGLVAIVLINEKHAFYMPMGRFWEIAVGGVVACTERHLTASGLRSNILAALGFAGVLGSTVALDDSLQYPGWVAAIPVVGAALVIAFARTGWVTSLLSVRPLVVAGRWSYSIYLIHWPMIVYWRLFVGRPLLAYEQVAIIAITIGLAALSSRFVERPLRAGSGSLANRPALGAIAFGSVAVLVVGGLVTLSQGAPRRMNADARDAIATLKTAIEQRPKCQPDLNWLGNPKLPKAACRWGSDAHTDFVVWGDSHAGMIAPELSQALQRMGMSGGVSVGLPACFPLSGIQVGARKNNSLCPAFVNAVIAAVQRDKPRVVIMASRWATIESPIRSPGDGGKPVQIVDIENGLKPISLLDALTRTIERLGTRVIIFAPVPEIEFHVPNALVRSLQGVSTMPRAPRSTYDLRQKYVMAAFAKLPKGPSLAIVYPHSVLCGAETCDVIDGHRSLYVDDDHLSPFGVARVLPLFEPVIAP